MPDVSDLDILELRKRLRREALARRDALDVTDRAAFSDRISDSLIALLSQSNARFVHCYISFRTEVGSRSLIEKMIAQQMRVATPVIDLHAGPRALIHTELAGLSNLQSGAFGLEEPVERTATDLAGLDAVILPMVAFDRRGSRL